MPLPPPHIRWMIRRDMFDVLRIEDDAFEFPWAEDDFIRALRARNVIGMVAEIDDQILGYAIYELHKDRLHVVNIAVAHRFRREGVGRAIINRLIDKLSPNRRSRIMLEVRETNLSAQKFFRRMGFRAVSILKDFYEDTTEDAYLMQYRLSAPLIYRGIS